ncbi:Tetratricopeptide repeat-containing protein, partial [Candidatus Methanophagaceae archaeon]
MNQCFVDKKIEKHKVLQAGLYNNLGIIQLHKGKYKKALDYFKNSITVTEIIGDI